MLRAVRLFTGPDNASYVEEGSIDPSITANALSISFKESAPHAALDWHDAPVRQFVITLAGTLEFITRDGTTFTIRPGDVLVAEDTAGSGHAWRLVDDEPWRRAYVVLAPSAADVFVKA